MCLRDRPTVEDVKRYRADQRNVHLQASVGAGGFTGLWENRFQGTEYESYKYGAALLGGVVQPLMVLRALTNITDAIPVTYTHIRAHETVLELV